MRVFANTAFEQEITTLRYTPDCYRITTINNEFTLMNTCGKCQANFGSLFTVHDFISQKLLILLMIEMTLESVYWLLTHVEQF